MIVVRGGGDLASGVVYRLYRAGIKVVITELSQPLVVRRLVSFAEAIYRGQFCVEGVESRRVESVSDALRMAEQGIVPVLIDPVGSEIRKLNPLVVVDARMLKKAPSPLDFQMPLLIGLGPGFYAGENCQAVIETNRGHMLGRVFWEGAVQLDTGIPEAVAQFQSERVLRSPEAGKLIPFVEIGDHLEQGERIAQIGDSLLFAPFKGVLRGLLYPGLMVKRGMKIGDLDPRDDPQYCTKISEKSLAIGGGVLEAVLTIPEIRDQLWN
jgi:xanthine dehydrogenase accessory factor